MILQICPLSIFLFGNLRFNHVNFSPYSWLRNGKKNRYIFDHLNILSIVTDRVVDISKIHYEIYSVANLTRVPSWFSRGKRVQNRKCSKLVKNHPINQFWHEESIGNGFRMIWLFLLYHRFPWWKRVRKLKMFQISRKSSYKPILTWKSIGNGYRMIWLFLLDQRFPWWKSSL